MLSFFFFLFPAPKSTYTGGTLDPRASGCLVIGMGSKTKLLGNMLCGSKAYEAEGVLGVETDSQETVGEVVR